MGLIKAIDRYDPELGPFVRFAVPNIIGELVVRSCGDGLHGVATPEWRTNDG